MARIRNYTPDGALSGEDRLVGSSYEGEGARGAKYKTKTYKLSELAAYFNTFDSNGISLLDVQSQIDNIRVELKSTEIAQGSLNNLFAYIVNTQPSSGELSINNDFAQDLLNNISSVPDTFVNSFIYSINQTKDIIIQFEQFANNILGSATLTEEFANEILDLTTSLNYASSTEFNSLFNTVTNINTSVNSLLTRVTVTENNISSIFNKTDNIELDVLAAESNITFLQNGFTTLTSTVNTNTNDISTNATSISSLGTRVTTAEANITTAQSDITSLTTTVNTNTSDISSNATSISTLGTRITTAESDISAIETDVTSLTTTVNTNTSDISTNASSISSLNTSVSTNTANISAAQTNITTLQTDVSNNSTDISTNANSISTLSTTVTTQGTNISNLQSNLTSLTTTVNTNTGDIATNATSISTLGTTVTNQGNTISGIQTDLTTLTGTVNTNTGNITSNATDISTLQTRVTTAEADITAVESDVTTLTSSVNTNTGNISTNASNISSLSTSVSTNTTNISAAQTSITNLTTTVNTNTGNISANATSISTLTTTVGNNTTSISTNQASINGIEGRYGVTIDANGSIAGFQLLNGTNTSSSFIVTANTFEITDGTSTASPFIVTSNQVRLNVPLNGVSGTFSGALSAATGTFAGSLSAATGTFAGALSAATGTFSGNLSAAGGTFSGDISGASGTFTGSLSGADITGATGTFSDTVQVGSGSGQITIDSTGISVASGDFDIDATGAASFSGTINVGGLVIDGNKVDFIETGTTTETFPLNFKDANGTIVAGIKAFGLNTTPILDVFSNYRIQIDATDNMVLDADSFIQITSGDFISIEPIDDIYFKSTGTATQRAMVLGSSSDQFTYMSSYVEDLIQLRVTDGTISAVSGLTMGVGYITLEAGSDVSIKTKNNQIAPDISRFEVGDFGGVFDSTIFWSEDVLFKKSSNQVGEFHVGTISDTYDQVYLYGEDILFQPYATTVGDFRIGQTIRKFNIVQLNSITFNGEVDTFDIHPDVDNTGSFSIGNSITDYAIINFYGNVSAKNDLAVVGALSKGSGSFKIDHPLESKKDTHDLVHSFVESPQANNIYRGKVQLQNGAAQINLDEVSSMTEGTFEALNRDIHVYTTNESDWDAVKGSITGNILTIECQNQNSTATVSWLVIGERQDKHMYETGWTDDNGKVIVEPLKQTNNG